VKPGGGFACPSAPGLYATATFVTTFNGGKLLQRPELRRRETAQPPDHRSCFIALPRAAPRPCHAWETGAKIKREKVAKRAAPTHVHSAHAAIQLLTHRTHPHTPAHSVGRPVFFCCALRHVYRRVILDFDLTRVRAGHGAEAPAQRADFRHLRARIACHLIGGRRWGSSRGG